MKCINEACGGRRGNSPINPSWFYPPCGVPALSDTLKRASKAPDWSRTARMLTHSDMCFLSTVWFHLCNKSFLPPPEQPKCPLVLSAPGPTQRPSDSLIPVTLKDERDASAVRLFTIGSVQELRRSRRHIDPNKRSLHNLRARSQQI